MPRIRDSYLDCVVYLYPSKSDAKNGEKIGGSGFLIGMVSDDGLTGFIYIVTNRHVIENANYVIRMKTKTGENEIIEADERGWRFHPDGDDLAILFLFFDPRNIRLSVVTISDFLTKKMVSQFNIGPGDETFLVGRFINHDGKQQNLPSVRFGCIAQMPFEPVKKGSGTAQESFLVESKSIGGYSGSPVFIYIPFGSERENVTNWGPSSELSDQTIQPKDFGILQSHGPWLLGVDWGYMADWTPVCGPAGQPVNPNNPKSMQVSLNTGISTVVPAWKLTELLFSREVVDDRVQLVEQMRLTKESLSKGHPQATHD